MAHQSLSIGPFTPHSIFFSQTYSPLLYHKQALVPDQIIQEAGAPEWVFQLWELAFGSRNQKLYVKFYFYFLLIYSEC
ncbi:unnamed protein product, partial [Rotaria magnacalcarata]